MYYLKLNAFNEQRYFLYIVIIARIKVDGLFLNWLPTFFSFIPKWLQISK